MIIELSVAFIALAFVILVVFLIITLVKSGKTLKETNSLLRSAKKDMNEMSEEGQKLIRHLDDVTVDVKRKLHVLDHFIKPISAAEHEIEAKNRKIQGSDLTTDILEGLAAGMVLYSKIKEGIKEYGKNR